MANFSIATIHRADMLYVSLRRKIKPLTLAKDRELTLTVWSKEIIVSGL